MKYTLVAYKPDHTDYCMNCAMDSFPAFTEIHSGMDEDTLIETWAKCIAMPKNSRDIEPGVLIFYPFEGKVTVFNSAFDADVERDYDLNQTDEYFEKLDHTKDYIWRLKDRVNDRVKQLVDEYDMAEQKRIVDEIARKKAYDDECEKREFARLAKKFKIG